MVGLTFFFGGSRTDFLDIFSSFFSFIGKVEKCERCMGKQRVATSGAVVDEDPQST